LYHHFRNDAFYDLYNLLKVRKTGNREVVLLQPLPESLYLPPKGYPLRGEYRGTSLIRNCPPHPRTALGP
jgi:hypothetical protein